MRNIFSKIEEATGKTIWIKTYGLTGYKSVDIINESTWGNVSRIFWFQGDLIYGI